MFYVLSYSHFLTQLFPISTLNPGKMSYLLLLGMAYERNGTTHPLQDTANQPVNNCSSLLSNSISREPYLQ